MKRKLLGAETPTFQKPVPMPPIKPAKETSVITNYDRIVSKSPEDLAEWLADYTMIAKEGWLDWMEQEG